MTIKIVCSDTNTGFRHERIFLKDMEKQKTYFDMIGLFFNMIENQSQNDFKINKIFKRLEKFDKRLEKFETKEKIRVCYIYCFECSKELETFKILENEEKKYASLFIKAYCRDCNRKLGDKKWR